MESAGQHSGKHRPSGRLPAGGRNAHELSPAVVTASRRHLTSRYATGLDSFLWETDQILLTDRAAIQSVVRAARSGHTGLGRDLVAALVLIQVVRRDLEAEEAELRAAAGHTGLSREILAAVSGPAKPSPMARVPLREDPSARHGPA